MSKSLILLIFLITAATGLSAQTDSVLVGVDYGLVSSEWWIVSKESDRFIREHYTNFKNKYFFAGTDTTTEERKSISQNKINYSRRHHCDSLVNTIRNSSSVNSLKTDVNRKMRSRIGHDNKEFDRHFIENPLHGIYRKCKRDFTLYLDSLRQSMDENIEAIHSGKLKRLEYFKQEIKTVQKEEIKHFLDSMNQCPVDLQVLELVIIHHSTFLLEYASHLGDHPHFILELRLTEFPMGTDIDQLRDALRNSTFNYKQKNNLIKRIGIKDWS